jgi:hypothetical protein
MLKTIDGVYRDGKVELTEVPADVHDETRVLVTFLISAAPTAAAPLKEGRGQSRDGCVRWLRCRQSPFTNFVLLPLLIYTPPHCVGLLLS